MDRISDERLNFLVKWYTETAMERNDEDVASALVELRERRASEKEPKPDPYLADWTNIECPKCNHYSVCVDKFGYRCVIDGCGWTKDDPVKK
jgi:hypothetical protein